MLAITPLRGRMFEPAYAAPAAASTARADRMHARGVITLLVGGALYSAGAAVYAVKWPRLWPRVFGYHEVFHVFVIAATAVYFVFITATVAVPR